MNERRAEGGFEMGDRCERNKVGIGNRGSKLGEGGKPNRRWRMQEVCEATKVGEYTNWSGIECGEQGGGQQKRILESNVSRGDAAIEVNVRQDMGAETERAVKSYSVGNDDSNRTKGERQLRASFFEKYFGIKN